MKNGAALQAADGSVIVCEKTDCHSPATTPRYDGYYCTEHDPYKDSALIVRRLDGQGFVWLG